jgi:hypothetical protein
VHSPGRLCATDGRLHGDRAVGGYVELELDLVAGTLGHLVVIADG